MADETNPTLTELADKLAAATAEIESLKSSHAAAEAAWGEERAGLSVGLDAEGLGVARHLYGAQPADKRPAFDAWLVEQKALPSKALSPWFAAPAPAPAPAPAAPASTPAPGGGAPPSPAGTGLPAPGGEGNQSVDSVIQRAIQSGDWSEYNKIRGSLLRPQK